MVKQADDIIDDFEGEDNRVEQSATKAAEHAMRNISKLSGDVRYALYDQPLYRPSLHLTRNPDFVDARNLRIEAKRLHRDLPKNEQTDYREREAEHRAVLMALPEEKLRAIERPYPPSTQADTRINIGTIANPVERDARATVRFRNRSLKSGFLLRNGSDSNIATFIKEGHTPEELEKLIAGKSEKELRDLGITVNRGRRLLTLGLTKNRFNPLTQEQAKRIVEAPCIADLVTKEGMRRSFANGGVSEMNVQMALAFMREYPSEIHAAISSNPDSISNERKKLVAQSTVVDSLAALSGISKENQSFDYEQIVGDTGEIEAVKRDLRNLATLASAESTVGRKLLLDGYMPATVPADVPVVRRALNEEEKQLKASQKYYEKIQATINRLHKAAVAADIDNKDINDFFTGDDFDPESLKKELDPKILADKLRTELNLKNKKEDYDSEIDAKQKEVDEIKSGAKIKSGRENVLSAFQKYFEIKERMPSTEARRAAEELYARNSLGNRELQVALRTANEKNVFGDKARIAGWPLRQVKELATGSQESFVSHIAESTAVGLDADLSERLHGPGNLLSRTRRLGVLWRKHNARAGWGAMDYPQLLTSFYALRKAVQEGKLANTGYVRNQRDMILRLLLSNYAKDITKDFDQLELAPEARKAIEGKNQQLQLQQQIRQLVAGEIPPHYVDEVNQAVEYAQGQTGTLRRGTGRGVGGAATSTAKFGVDNGLKKPAKIAKATIKYPFKKVAQGARGAKSWLFDEKSKFF